MATEWREMTLGDFVALQRGHDLTESQRRIGSVPVMGSAGQNGYHDTALTKGPGIVIGRSGASFGQVHYSAADFWPHNTALYVTDFKGNDERFAFYFLKAINFDRYNSGSAQASLNRNFIYPIRVRIPPLTEQKAIAAALGALDDKIELNRQINATLEAMARALFQSWFVDFDPVRAKLDGRQPAGLDRATVALFPNEFEDSALGPIPKGWRIGKVDEILTFIRRAVDPSETPNEFFAHYSLPAFDEGRTPKLEAGNAIKSQKLVVPSDAVLLSKLNPHIPRIWLLDVTADYRAICSTEFLVAQPKPGFGREFLFCLFTGTDFASEYATLVTGTTGSHQRVKGESLLQMKTTLPATPVIECFTSIARPMLNRVIRNIRESTTLAAIRDVLLPKLLSGDVQIKTKSIS